MPFCVSGYVSYLKKTDSKFAMLQCSNERSKVQVVARDIGRFSVKIR